MARIFKIAKGSRHQQVLKPGALVQGETYTYTIVKVLGEGAYGVTYLATTKVSLAGDLGTVDTEVQVTLKEFYMSGRMSREGDLVNRNIEDTQTNSFARCFFMEADRIASLSHPNIVKVIEVFVANNTCYYAMEYLSGGTLAEYVDKRDGLKETEAIAFVRQIGSALSYMHQQKMLHLDVKPYNIMLSADGTPKLIDYGLAQQYASDGTLDSTDGLGSGTPGYAPLEQAEQSIAQYFSPTLDVYALGATYYRLLTGKTPPRAIDVLNIGINGKLLASRDVSQQSIDAIRAAMQPVVDDRLKSVDEFLDMLPSDVRSVTSGDGAGRLWSVLLVILAIIVIASVIAIIIV